MRHIPKRLALTISLLSVAVLALSVTLGPVVPAHVARAAAPSAPFCQRHSSLCTDPVNKWGPDGQYIGHDEPMVHFYSNVPGSGNSMVYRLRLPSDPPTLPSQDGTGGTWNFQLHPTFWFGMALCDTQSAPEYNTDQCTPDSDANIYDSTDPNSARYMGKHPGTAYLELQFYPPGWTPWPDGFSCDPTQWCAGLSISSYDWDMNHDEFNNAACSNTVGIEPGNFAFITHSGQAQAPADPLDATLASYTPDPAADLFMSSGDWVTADLHDTAAGVQAVIQDLTTGQSGSMTASIANQFGQVKWDPTGTTCQNIPYAFHPMYATSSEATATIWALDSTNVSYSDEIGHFEYCDAISGPLGNCTAAGATDPSGVDGDDQSCLTSEVGTSNGQLAGCQYNDTDFDGPEYQNTWPGTNPDPTADAQVHPQPIAFSSPLFKGMGASGYFNYSHVAFETDLPVLERSLLSPNNNCQIFFTDPSPGSGCTMPPNGGSFYPFYSTLNTPDGCIWQEGGAYLPGASYPAGTTPQQAYGSLLKITIPYVGGPFSALWDFRKMLNTNPCPATFAP